MDRWWQKQHQAAENWKLVDNMKSSTKDWPLILVGGFFAIVCVLIVVGSLYFGVGGF